MKFHSKLWTMAAGSMALVSAVALAQQEDAPPIRSATSATDKAVVISGRLVWLAKSDLSAKHEGVLDSLEFREGMRVEEGQEIGKLDTKLAVLTVAKQQQQVNLNDSQKLKADAQKQQALAVYARMKRANDKVPNAHSKEEIEKSAADLNYADALVEESVSKKRVDEADLEIAKASLDHHSIKAPFTGVIIERLKNPGEAIRANEPVVRMGKTDAFQFVGWMPLEYVENVRVGDVVQFRPVIDGAKLSIENQVFQGKLTAIGPEVSSVQKTEIRVFAEVINPPQPEHPERELFEGIQGDLSIMLAPGRTVSIDHRTQRVESVKPVASAATRSRGN